MTSHTGLQYFEHLLDAQWEEQIDGRYKPVPEPTIAIAADVDTSRLSQQSEDLLFIHEGGPDSITPRSVGWTEKRQEELVTLDLRTSVARARLEGTRDDDNNEERYGGLRGETERILDTVRRGDKEFDWINGYEYRPLSEELGYGFWRGIWEVRLTELAHDIDPTP